ncbi:MAG: LytTR family DNA-binding domain-containing protein [Niameybacter sp.]|uniref:LytTR family DNA-binding domain-containing protein n=1 Tax=Niameybacter sp. TaxID=2033640 RepID=UPI002FC73470
MKVTIEEVEDLKETEISIRCKHITPELLNFINDLACHNQKIVGVDQQESFLIEPNDIYYIESVDDKVFAYTKDRVYLLSFKLYELEKKLSATYFFRASKSVIVNLAHIVSLKTLFNGRMQVTMKSGDYVIITRSYVGEFKEKLGVHKK